MGEPIRVIIADDHLIVREGVRQLLELDGDIRVVDCVGDAAALLRNATTTPVDVVLTDIRMPPNHRLEGIEAAHELRRTQPATGVVVLSAHAEEAYAVELFRDGTSGLAYLLKDRVGDRAELVRAIRAVAAGGSVIDPVVVEAMMRRHHRESSSLARLTARERAVLEKMAGGLSNGAISRDLYLSVSAVEKHITAIFTKLGLLEQASTHRRVAAVLAFLTER